MVKILESLRRSIVGIEGAVMERSLRARAEGLAVAGASVRYLNLLRGADIG